MRALLDTHAFLWWNTDDPRLSLRARQAIAEPGNDIYLSAASAWEITIKAARGRLILPEPPGSYVLSRMILHRLLALPVHIHHTALVYELDTYHNDPFDRLLIAQGIAEHLPILTADPQFARYPADVIC
jgi:PIN domain nuclease of toxin-antitoxin system